MKTGNKTNLISHSQADEESFDLNQYEQKLKNKDELTLPLDHELELLKQLSEFELGRFLLKNKVLNAYWTSYAILNDLDSTKLHPLEEWLLTSAPVLKATRERFNIFKHVIQEHLKDDMTIASIPCGMMDDLLSLNIAQYNNIKFVGSDFDSSALELAEENSENINNKNVSFLHEDAWSINVIEQYDMIVSNGLNIYEPDNAKVTDLYINFYKALKPAGILVTSFLTPPPNISNDSAWKNYELTDVLKQKAILSDIIDTNWQTFRTESQTSKQLTDAGFDNIEYIYDYQGMFPTVIATK